MTEDQKPELHLVEGGEYDTTAPDIDGAFIGGRVIYNENKVVFDDGRSLPLVTDELPEGFTIVEEGEATSAELIPGIVTQGNTVNISQTTVSDRGEGETMSADLPLALTEEQMIELLTREVSFALMKWWFPNRIPVGDDYDKWVDISIKDASAVVEHLMKIGILKLEKINDDDGV